MAEDFGLMDLSKVKPVPLPKTLLLINNFVLNTTRFLNHFSTACEDKLLGVSEKITQLEIGLAMIEAKLRSVPELQAGLSRPSPAEIQPASTPAPSPAPAPSPLPSQAAPPLPAPPTSASSDVQEAAAPPPPPAPPAEDTSGMIPISQHPDYATFFKMLRVGVPDPVVRGKMGMLGLDPSILDTPDKLVPAPQEQE